MIGATVTGCAKTTVQQACLPCLPAGLPIGR